MNQSTQYGFYVDTTKCTGCKACHVSCKDRQGDLLRANNKPLANGVPSLKGVTWRRVYEYCGGSWSVDPNTQTYSQDVFAYYMSIGCNHCSEPVCVKACPTGAMHKRREDGLVHVEESLCIGCESCARACPYDAPQIDRERKVMTKCDGCHERLAEGRQPVCVESCPMRALDFDTMDNLRAKYGDGDGHIAPLPSESITSPNLIIKANRHGQPAGSGAGKVLNPTEV
ncbi:MULTISPECIES: DMSO/selenate family reductase complex B subunit [Shewanella]|jgi:anaerobic dimethyl sulfoxide reductase subunit B (iron-sulfur subunit)|uniref:Anaerobic dimethyl sulfoxide reductase subunit B (Iron-sulfur subunit) n=2 Tax=Shewanella TaxID=22 RepID=A0A6G7LWC4_9GAMM|nr:MULTISPECIES: DMSO/selenate family reductase complex B subunit [Shewanella]MBO2639835.1 dimethylsulfoxide reductase subunit B [Shewanella algae]MCA0949888.1 dimethylsulfoxide reductase subunit B [Shewanella chilikensis]MCE9791927.1 dimethylsulfoxide reductase subunit B [Shewanella indica]MCE9851143.1 dimethylsulfoxide reductase subunit B [Shewanella chilikensis]MCL1155191.1 dimethylsulfoxide reductase subunit B [Shewanella chilikensis]